MSKAMQAEGSNTSLDLIKWFAVLALLSVGIAAHVYYADAPVAWRVLGFLAMTAFALVIAFQTNVGRKTWKFIQASRVELRKVVWPTRQETLQVTLVVSVLVAVTSVILWAIDGVLLRMMTWVTGA